MLAYSGVRLHPLDAGDREAVRLALLILKLVKPEGYAHFDRVFGRHIFVDTTGEACGIHALACTGAGYWRTVVLAQYPEYAELEDLVVTLDHESRHYAWNRWTREYELAPHACSDPGCSNWWERANDPIYQEDERLRLRVRRYLTALRNHYAYVVGW